MIIKSLMIVLFNSCKVFGVLYAILFAIVLSFDIRCMVFQTFLLPFDLTHCVFFEISPSLLFLSFIGSPA